MQIDHRPREWLVSSGDMKTALVRACCPQEAVALAVLHNRPQTLGSLAEVVEPNHWGDETRTYYVTTQPLTEEYHERG